MTGVDRVRPGVAVVPGNSRVVVQVPGGRKVVGPGNGHHPSGLHFADPGLPGRHLPAGEFEEAASVVPGFPVIPAPEQDAVLAGGVGAVGHLEDAGHGKQITVRGLNAGTRDLQQFRVAPGNDPRDCPGSAVVLGKRNDVISRQDASRLFDADALLRVVAVEAVADGDQTTVPQPGGLHAIAGHHRVHRLVVKRPLQGPASPPVLGPRDNRGGVGRLEGFPKDKQSQQLPAGQLQQVGKNPVATVDLRPGIVVNGDVFYDLDHQWVLLKGCGRGKSAPGNPAEPAGRKPGGGRGLPSGQPSCMVLL